MLELLAQAQGLTEFASRDRIVVLRQSGGKSEIRNGPRGQYGVCILPDGQTVEEWAYFRKMKGKSGKAPN